MSADTIDDLHGAEDLMGSLAARMEKLLRAFDAGEGDTFGAMTGAREVLAEVDDYCRPSCGHRYEGYCSSGDECGCPCGHETEGG